MLTSQVISEAQGQVCIGDWLRHRRVADTVRGRHDCWRTSRSNPRPVRSSIHLGKLVDDEGGEGEGREGGHGTRRKRIDREQDQML
jgi:hypothetical protein